MNINNLILIFLILILIIILLIILNIKGLVENVNESIKKNWTFIGVLLGISFIFISLFSPYFLTNILSGKELNPNEIGDTIGGTMGPFVGIAGVIFTFLAFYMQKLANDEIKNQFIIQKFESQFYEMLKLHKENVNEVKYIEENDKTFTGRRAFEELYSELKHIYKHIERLSRDNLDNNSILKKSYLIFFFGIRSKQNQLNCQYKNGLDIEGTITADDNIYLFFTQNKPMNISYCSGHSNYLAHIYRHLYLTVKFVADEDEKIISYKEKRKYLRILRAQLSNFEQALLFYNWKAGFGEKWEQNDKSKVNNFFTDYRMIHNLNNEMLFDNTILEDVEEFKRSLKKESGKENDPLFEFQD
ncbi:MULTISPECIES: putative phage abortive infection protein [Chryseobacterium]|uniref:Phage abortive infection protein n=1 Tax=Chryseobacterium culicis TaxID=680127 RepID=A0A2S9D072_CHRCI|nr:MULTISPECIES: putative phage abortive infection protein [Chryseobacterium]PRB86110.1 hypothetical protein CQ022_07630 [Chryseobacterium culicis]PRB91863.1 hypothetical protein CQ033_01300 [Chryseobacterium culicis]